MNSTISRRTFLAGASTAAASALVASSAIAEEAKSEQADAQAESAQAADELLYTASINPQDSDWLGTETDFATLFSPWKLGNIELSHRMVKSAAGSATYLAGYTDELFDYYVNLAKGGVEMIWVEGEAFALGEDGTFGADALDFGKRLVEACAEYGSHLGYQWALFGSSVAEDAMTVEQIQAMEDVAATYATQLKEMGFEAIEINAAGFNQGEQFLSRFYNTRTDEYGFATPENRSRWVCECIQKIKAAAGEDFVVQILINCIEDNDNLDNSATLMTTDNMVTNPRNKVTTVEEGIAMAKCMEQAGADSMHLRLGPLGNHPCQFGSDLYFLLNGIEGATGFGTQYDFSKNWQGYLDGSHQGAGMLIGVVERYKQALSIPCGCVTYNDPAHAPEFFEQALAEGKVDFYMMTRPLTVDFDYVNKLREGRIDEIAPCTRCLHCHIGSNQMNRALGYCRVNALTQRVMTENGPATYELEPAAAPKNVMVVGGGPAGMEAARIAAERGHNVTLYEKQGYLGGLMNFMSAIKGPHQNLADYVAWSEGDLGRKGVTVVTGQEVTADFVAEQAPDAVILATGGLRDEPTLAGDDKTNVVPAADVAATEIGQHVTILGGNCQACDVATYLLAQGKHVTIVMPDPINDLSKGQSIWCRKFSIPMLYTRGTRVWEQAELLEAAGGQARVKTAHGAETVYACDTVVDARDMLPNEGLADKLKAAGVEVYEAGDCCDPWNIQYAVRSGNIVGRTI